MKERKYMIKKPQHRLLRERDASKVINLLARVFKAAEGPAEGQVIGQLVSRLIAETPADDLLVCVTFDQEQLVGAVFFSRLQVPGGDKAFLLSPMAVATEAQGKGLGQALIQYGLDLLRSHEVALVVTYGDPAFYKKTGFQPITQAQIPPPFPLSQPIGWLAQSLIQRSIPEFRNAIICVPAFNDPSLW
ncbi:GNAT family N-acetyltransferase [Marinicella sediminis]|uniref:GNAT family N-acetyltransferase n=1 Tax=Marinicella sediminis TaxID=1792834 RepID=A0ABV7J3X8_9GAMM|nr:N-acetyltransferase [Marinicella sediminis]